MADDQIIIEPTDDPAPVDSDEWENDIGRIKIVDVEPDCATCVHQVGYEWGKCAAFPNGIPDAILTGEASHVDPWPDGEELPVQYSRRFA
jgi:hypothetical protein